MDISAKTRVLKSMTDECLRLVRTVGRLTSEEADRCLDELPTKMRMWIDLIEAPSAETQVPELRGPEGYGLWADTYDNDPNNRVILAEEDYIWHLIGNVRGKRLLDVGSGTGRHAIRLADMGADVVATEPNPTLLAVAKAKAVDPNSRIQWLNHDVETLPSDIGEFDMVLCCLVLSHIEDLRLAISKLSARLKTGGSLVISDFHPFNLMIGWRTSFFHSGRKYVVPNYLHLPSAYFSAMKAASVSVDEFLEVGDFPQLPDQPATLIMKGHKSEKSNA